MEALSQQITVRKGETFKGIFELGALRSYFDTSSNIAPSQNVIGDPANPPATVGNITITGDSTTGDGIVLYPNPNTTAGAVWINPWPYPGTTILPNTAPFPTIVPTEPVIIEPVEPVTVQPFIPFGPVQPRDWGVEPIGDQLTEGLIRRLEELLERAKQQRAAEAAPEKKQEAAPAPAEDDADVDSARFRNLEPKKADGT